ncbi:MAG TPA: AAA family ATPase [Vicinamibacterales bacterium]
MVEETLTYEPHFGLIEKPFSLNADSRFVYESAAYASSRERLLAGIRRREGLNVLTGEIGTGKTTLCRDIIEELGRKTYSSIVPDPFASREDLLKMLLIDFGVLSIQDLTSGRLQQASRTELGYLLSDFLDKLTPESFAVVMIDEAQNLALPLIEETRILADTFGAHGRLQMVFIGQPELHSKLKLPEMRQVDQRVCGYHRLSPLNLEAVTGYIRHRLHAAGGRGDRVLFAPDIIETLHRRTGGVPRLINRVCDRALQLAFEQRAKTVDRETLETALLEVGSTTLSPTWDAIIAESKPSHAAAAPVAAPVPAAAPVPPAPVTAAKPAAPAIDEDDSFDKQIDHWVEKDLGPASKRRPSSVLYADAPVRRSAAPAVARRPSTVRQVTSEWPRDVRSETYIGRLLRKWAMRAALAFAVFIFANLALGVGAMLLAIQEPATLPAYPAAPAKPLPAVIATVAPDAATTSSPSQ